MKNLSELEIYILKQAKRGVTIIQSGRGKGAWKGGLHLMECTRYDLMMAGYLDTTTGKITSKGLGALESLVS